jgi:hypothetical protein
VTYRVTAAEAFLLYITKRGLEGDGAAARSAMTVLFQGRSRVTGRGRPEHPVCGRDQVGIEPSTSRANA